MGSDAELVRAMGERLVDLDDEINRMWVPTQRGFDVGFSLVRLDGFLRPRFTATGTDRKARRIADAAGGTAGRLAAETPDELVRLVARALR